MPESDDITLDDLLADDDTLGEQGTTNDEQEPPKPLTVDDVNKAVADAMKPLVETLQSAAQVQKPPDPGDDYLSPAQEALRATAASEGIVADILGVYPSMPPEGIAFIRQQIATVGGAVELEDARKNGEAIMLADHVKAQLERQGKWPEGQQVATTKQAASRITQGLPPDNPEAREVHGLAVADIKRAEQYFGKFAEGFKFTEEELKLAAAGG